jgi:CubicO group peptidase (beta-lactamase class C family)
MKANILFLATISLFFSACHKTFELDANNEDTSIQSLMDSKKIAGMSIVMIKDFQIASVRNFGFADKYEKTLVDNNTLFQAASVSKAVTAFGVWKAIENNLFTENTSANSLMKNWQIPSNNFGNGNDITVLDLLTHSAGTSVSGFEGYKSGSEIPTVVEILNGTKPSNSAKIELIATPKQQYAYSGGGFTILQNIMDQVNPTAKFDETMKKLVLNPCNMSQSFFGAMPENKQHKAATGYSWSGVAMPSKWHTHPELAAAGLWTTATDIANWVIAVQRSLQGNANAVMKKPFAEKYVTKKFTKSADEGMAGGVFVHNYGQATPNYFSHDGSNHGYSTYFIGHLSKGYGMVILTNKYQAYNSVIALRNELMKKEKWDGF